SGVPGLREPFHGVVRGQTSPSCTNRDTGGPAMGAVLLILAILGGVVLADAVVENTDAGTVTLFGQTVTGLTVGGLLVLAAALGAVITCLLLFSVPASRRRRAPRAHARTHQRSE